MRYPARFPTLTPLLALIVLIVAIFVVYAPGLKGPFVFDDIPNIVKNEAVRAPQPGLAGLADAAWSGDSGPLKRPIAYLSFALNAMFAKGTLNTFPFKLTNVLIHAFNAILVLVLGRRILQISPTDKSFPSRDKYLWLPLAAAVLWALHPLQTTAVLHVVQRMTSLSASFVLLGTILFLAGRDNLHALPRRGWTLMGAGLGVGLVGLLAKENAAVMPFLLLTIEYTLYAKQLLDARTRKQLKIFYSVVCGVPLLLVGALILAHPDFISGTYIGRDFDVGERLLTQARALWFYLGLLAVPDLTKVTLFHDDFPLSLGLVDPWTTLPAVIGGILVITAAVLARHRSPLLSLAILWFLVGHGVESTVIGLELVHEHRNYLPSVMLFIAITRGMGSVFQRTSFAILACFVLALTYGGITFLQSHAWSREDTLIESMARHRPLSAQSRAMMGEMLAYQRGALEDALPHYRSAMQLDPSYPGFVIQMVLATAHFTTPEKKPAHTVALPDLPELSDLISRQLAARRPSLSTLDVLDTAVNCVVEVPHNCRDLYSHVLRWCLALLDEPDISPDVRSFATDRALYLTTWKKEYKHALEIVTRARQAEPGNDYYAFLEADVHFRVGALDEAERVARTVRDDYPVRGLREKTHQLLSAISSARAGADDPGRSPRRLMPH